MEVPPPHSVYLAGEILTYARRHPAIVQLVMSQLLTQEDLRKVFEEVFEVVLREEQAQVSQAWTPEEEEPKEETGG